MKHVFLCKRGRSDAELDTSFLAARTNKSAEQDWGELARLLSFIATAKKDVLTLEADGTRASNWYVNAPFAAHPDMKSRTGSAFPMSKGSRISGSIKQKRNA